MQWTRHKTELASWPLVRKDCSALILRSTMFLSDPAIFQLSYFLPLSIPIAVPVTGRILLQYILDYCIMLLYIARWLLCSILKGAISQWWVK